VSHPIQSYQIQIKDQHLVLTTERCMYWSDQNLLILSDTHFGKSGHFRKEGIGLPQGVLEQDLKRLKNLILQFQPKGLLIIGDLFHSTFNQEISVFKSFRDEFSGTDVHLINGNHDILNKNEYKKLSIEDHGKRLKIGPFTFVHDHEDISGEEVNYSFCGHLHPGVSIRGTGKQKLRLPCFYFTEKFACLPAFSLFTGLHLIKPDKNDATFMITDERIILLRPLQDDHSVIINHMIS